MDALAAATSTAAAVSTVGSHFMLDGKTYERGAELGFQGLDFYVTGRGGVLGDVDADVVSAAFTFFEPGARPHPVGAGPRGDARPSRRPRVRRLLRDLGRGPRARRRRRRTAGGAGRPGRRRSARPACATVFAGWRALPVPDRRPRPPPSTR